MPQLMGNQRKCEIKAKKLLRVNVKIGCQKKKRNRGKLTGYRGENDRNCQETTKDKDLRKELNKEFQTVVPKDLPIQKVVLVSK